MHVLMVAAENDTLPNAKVGGVADVIRDCPKALCKAGLKVDVVIPDYGFDTLDRIHLGQLSVPFAGQIHHVDAWQIKIDEAARQIVLSHHYFSQHNGQVYCNDAPGRPFATDAIKFALFSAAVCEGLLEGILPAPDVIHLHDWHSACVAVLLKFDSRFGQYANTKLVYTVHNLALQGIRPFKDDESSLEAWYPWLGYDGQALCDPRYPHCFNPMRSAINLADKVHLVSPTYANEVLCSSDPQNGFFGGEGLELDLQNAEAANKLVGILNGCDYTANNHSNETALVDLYNEIEVELFKWMAKNQQLESGYYIAHQRLLQFIHNENHGPLITSVGRLTEQKVLLLCQAFQGDMVIDKLCSQLASYQGRMIILGSGDELLEQTFTQAMARNSNLLYLKGYGQKIGELLYQLGDLFLMPSSFEPCGISQMLAMRDGQPCLVHQVGGLKDTVKHLENGFCFTADNLQTQSRQLVNCFNETLETHRHNPQLWQKIVKNALESRFTWHSAAKKYISNLYQ
ncbi:glycogen synthase [Pseudoalteromonas sp. A601]|uniref:glycogen synthase n=1 Tax=Pseudoalteromonas sp. A601 TaxID=1967839 RepID=UPI000B3C5DBB|nr:glycogen/starch synthase [Pseudoalteromonas sp. A601]OUS73553.1 glycogen synthase [Pseudoalteromonas sp. A601]